MSEGTKWALSGLVGSVSAMLVALLSIIGGSPRIWPGVIFAFTMVTFSARVAIGRL